ncbi:MAG TPA: hypothetical protein VNI54_03455 [Thermoanaerobaculia bacterium]|nr:hypothetical protein [Thermoanaerobaculia bacterium]
MKKIATLLATLSALSLAAAEATLYQSPTVNRTHIAFAWAGDVWSVAREGGVAQRLTAHAGIEGRPHFSPDGSLLAFTGEYDGNTDVFVMNATGGVPRRLTWHPGDDEVVGWTRDGKRVLFRSERESVRSYTQLFTIPLDGGGLPELVQLPHADEGSFSPDGSWIAVQPISQWQPDWKRHQGGQSGQIWLARLSDSHIERVPHKGSNDHAPVWVGDDVYFISDRDSRAGTKSIYAYNRKSGAVTQVVATGWTSSRCPPAPMRSSTSASARSTCSIRRRRAPDRFRSASKATSSGSGRTSSPRPTRSATPPSRPPARVPCSRHAATSSPCRRRRATRATSRARPASWSAIRPGLRTGSRSPTSPRSRASTRW